jgi:hypothetical protein
MAITQELTIAGDQRKLAVLTRISEIEREVFTLCVSMFRQLTLCCDSLSKEIESLQTQKEFFRVGF